MCKLKTRSRLAFSLIVQIWFQDPSLQALSFQTDSVPGSLPGHMSPTGGKEQKERPWKLGVDKVAPLCHTSAALLT